MQEDNQNKNLPTNIDSEPEVASTSPKPNISSGIFISGSSETSYQPMKTTRNIIPYLKISSVFIIVLGMLPIIGLLLVSLLFGGKTGSEFIALPVILLGFLGYVIVGPWSIINIVLFLRLMWKDNDIDVEPLTGILVGVATLIGLVCSLYGITQAIMINNQTQEIRTAGQIERDTIVRKQKAEQLALQKVQQHNHPVNTWSDVSAQEAIDQLNACNVHSFSYNDPSNTLLYDKKTVTGVMMSGSQHTPKVNIYLAEDGDMAVFDAARVARTENHCIQHQSGSFHYGR